MTTASTTGPATASSTAASCSCFTQRIRSDGPGGFTVTGTEIARFSLPGLEFEGMTLTTSPTRPNTEVLWGASVATHGRLVYVYGNQRVPGPWVFGKAGHVARVPAGFVDRPSMWLYWNGRTRTAWENAAVKVLDENVHGMSTNWTASSG